MIKISTDGQSTVYKVVVANCWYIAKFKNKQKLQLFEYDQQAYICISKVLLFLNVSVKTIRNDIYSQFRLLI